jgi:hypothetical protein
MRAHVCVRVCVCVCVYRNLVPDEYCSTGGAGERRDRKSEQPADPPTNGNTTHIDPQSNYQSSKTKEMSTLTVMDVSDGTEYHGPSLHFSKRSAGH